MSRPDHPEEDPTQKLPVTAEVGDEGGSYAEGTQQAATFSGVFGNPRVDAETAGSEAGHAAADRGADDDVTHATEPPRRGR